MGTSMAYKGNTWQLPTFYCTSLSVANKAHGVGYSAGLSWLVAAACRWPWYRKPLSLYLKLTCQTEHESLCHFWNLREHLSVFIRVQLFQVSLETSVWYSYPTPLVNYHSFFYFRISIGFGACSLYIHVWSSSMFLEFKLKKKPCIPLFSEKWIWS
jgi:hypothetical protein